MGIKGPEVVKTSRRDIPFIVAKKLDGATTVATTMIIASLDSNIRLVYNNVKVAAKLAVQLSKLEASDK